MKQDTCTREFGDDVAERWKSDADQNALINIPCFAELIFWMIFDL